MPQEQYANNAQTTLAAAVTAGATTLTVTSAAGFPAQPQFRIRIDDELLLVTGVSGTTWTVQRGIEGTTAAAHASGATVTHVLTAGGLLNLAGQLIIPGPSTSAPSSGIPGRIYLPNDVPVLLLDTGTAWQPFLPGHAPFTPPQLTAFTLYNQTTEQFTQVGPCILAVKTQSTIMSTCLLGVAVPNPPYRATCCWLAREIVNPTTYGHYGLAVYDANSGKSISLFNRASAYPRMAIEKWSNLTSYNSTYWSAPQLYQQTVWYQVADDGTNLIWRLSLDGCYFYTLFSASRTDWLTATHVGPIMSSNSTDGYGWLVHWKLETGVS